MLFWYDIDEYIDFQIKVDNGGYRMVAFPFMI